MFDAVVTLTGSATFAALGTAIYGRIKEIREPLNQDEKQDEVAVSQKSKSHPQPAG